MVNAPNPIGTTEGGYTSCIPLGGVGRPAIMRPQRPRQDRLIA